MAAHAPASRPAEETWQSFDVPSAAVSASIATAAVALVWSHSKLPCFDQLTELQRDRATVHTIRRACPATVVEAAFPSAGPRSAK